MRVDSFIGVFGEPKNILRYMGQDCQGTGGGASAVMFLELIQYYLTSKSGKVPGIFLISDISPAGDN